MGEKNVPQDGSPKEWPAYCDGFKEGKRERDILERDNLNLKTQAGKDADEIKSLRTALAAALESKSEVKSDG